MGHVVPVACHGSGTRAESVLVIGSLELLPPLISAPLAPGRAPEVPLAGSPGPALVRVTGEATMPRMLLAIHA